MPGLSKILLWITVFSVAMAFLESSVVVYLRALYYPSGFNFPLHQMDKTIGTTEVFREFSTLVMLICAGYFSGRSFARKFAGFIYCFAVWDIFYYIFLKLLINWPDSLFTWDILFLLPVEWTGPVIAPLITSCTMILLSWSIFYLSFKNEKQSKPFKLVLTDWLILAAGSLVIILSFTLDYTTYLIDSYSLINAKTLLSIDDIINLSLSFVPVNFEWILFWTGELIILVSVFLIYRRQRSVQKSFE